MSSLGMYINSSAIKISMWWNHSATLSSLNYLSATNTKLIKKLVGTIFSTTHCPIPVSNSIILLCLFIFSLSLLPTFFYHLGSRNWWIGLNIACLLLNKSNNMSVCLFHLHMFILSQWRFATILEVGTSAIPGEIESEG